MYIIKSPETLIEYFEDSKVTMPIIDQALSCCIEQGNGFFFGDLVDQAVGKEVEKQVNLEHLSTCQFGSAPLSERGRFEQAIGVVNHGIWESAEELWTIYEEIKDVPFSLTEEEFMNEGSRAILALAEDLELMHVNDEMCRMLAKKVYDNRISTDELIVDVLVESLVFEELTARIVSKGNRSTCKYLESKASELLEFLQCAIPCIENSPFLVGRNFKEFEPVVKDALVNFGMGLGCTFNEAAYSVMARAYTAAFYEEEKHHPEAA